MSQAGQGTSKSALPPASQARRKPIAFESGSLWVLDFGDKLKAPELYRPDIAAAIGEVSHDSATQLAGAMAFADQRPVINRLAGGRCFAARVEGEIATYCWLSTTHECIGELEHEIHLPPGEAYIWDCATLSHYRGNHLYTALLSYITTQLYCEGYKRVWIGASLENRPSLKAFSRAGFQPAATLYYIRMYNFGCLFTLKNISVRPNIIPTLHHMLSTAQEHTIGPFLFHTSRPKSIPPCLQAQE
jgi:ribosomal protein S18 acetylase RimI-like enzyme